MSWVPTGRQSKDWQFVGAERHVLLDLHPIESVSSTLGLDWYHIMATALVHADVDFVGLDLSHTWDSRAKVILE